MSSQIKTLQENVDELNLSVKRIDDKIEEIPRIEIADRSIMSDSIINELAKRMTGVEKQIDEKIKEVKNLNVRC